MQKHLPRARLTRLGLISLLLACAWAPEAEEKAPPPKIGEPAPQFSLTDSDGKERRLADYESRIIVLEWTDPGCPVVQRLYDASDSMAGTHRAVRRIDHNVAWLAINSTSSTSPEENNHWKRRHRIQYPILLDESAKVARQYDVRKAPEMFVIDRAGILRYRGALDDNESGHKSPTDVTNYVVAAVQKLVDGEAVSPNNVRPYGCRVKRSP